LIWMDANDLRHAILRDCVLISQNFVLISRNVMFRNFMPTLITLSQ
jgi:hypothetical protein